MIEKPLVAATRRLVKVAEDRVAARYHFKPGNDEAAFTPQLVAEMSQGASALLCTPTEPINAEAIALLPPP